MNKIIIFSVFALISVFKTAAQTTTAEGIKNKAYKIVFQLTNNDKQTKKWAYPKAGFLKER